MKQRGFIIPSPTMLLAGALAAACIVVAVQTWRLDSLQEEHAGFVADVKAKGDEQASKAKEIDEKHAKIVKEKDDELSTARTKFASDVKRLRDKHSSGSPVPEAPADSSKPSLACFDRTELNGALRAFLSEIDGFIIEGQSCAIELNNAREWAKDLIRSQ